MMDPDEKIDKTEPLDEDSRVVDWFAEIVDRIQAGESIDMEKLARIHPQRANTIRRILPALEIMAALRTIPTEQSKDGAPTESDIEVSREVMGDFRIVRELGRGGMGIVYEALQITVGSRRVALKILPIASAMDPRRAQRFQVEIQAASLLDHPHIVPIFAVGRERGVPYYAMKLIQGRSLAQVELKLRGLTPRRSDLGGVRPKATDSDNLATTLAQNLAYVRPETGHDDPPETKPDFDPRTVSADPDFKPASSAKTAPTSAPDTAPRNDFSTNNRSYFRSVARLGVQAAEALDYSHQKGVVHRDIKPSNLLVDIRGHLWIADFGLALMRTGSNLTPAGDRVGTLRYMSPEQALTRRVPVDHRTDIYSLGVTLYEMLTLRPAFRGKDPAQIIRQIAEDEPLSPRRLNPKIPRELETVILKAMAKDPEGRYETAGELATDLGRFLDHTPVHARRPFFLRRATSWVRRHRSTSIFVVSTIAILLIVISAWAGVQRAESESLIRRLESARLIDLPDLVPRLKLSNPEDIGRLGRLFDGGEPVQRLAAALTLAPIREDCRNYSLDRFLDGNPEEVKILVPMLQVRVPQALNACLKKMIDDGASHNQPAGVLADRRQANVACARILLGRPGSAWSLLKSTPEPQARSLLISTLGPADVKPQQIIAQLDDPSSADSARAAAILALEGVLEKSWTTADREKLTERLLVLYRDDPDAGVHGAAKWLLIRWNKRAELLKIDKELVRSRPDDPRFRWRISREHLTLVTVEDPTTGRVIEVADCEITVEMFRRFRQDFRFSVEFSGEENCPINSTSFHDASAFCNWLSESEKIDSGQTCYRPTGRKDLPFLPEPGHLSLTGYRLPTAHEFDLLCAGGTNTRRYFGDTDFLLNRYAWTYLSQEGRTKPVAMKIPNDLGLFDMLGNIQEWCEAESPIDAEGIYTADLRGGWFGWIPPSQIDRDTAFHNIWQTVDNPMNGFRVVRTKAVR